MKGKKTERGSTQDVDGVKSNRKEKSAEREAFQEKGTGGQPRKLRWGKNTGRLSTDHEKKEKKKGKNFALETKGASSRGKNNGKLIRRPLTQTNRRHKCGWQGVGSSAGEVLPIRVFFRAWMNQRSSGQRTEKEAVGENRSAEGGSGGNANQGEGLVRNLPG